MKKGTFQHPSKVHFHLINAKTMPTARLADVSRVKMCLIYAFLTRMEFNLEKIMLEHMARVHPIGAR